jgi:hypothetical protein
MITGGLVHMLLTIISFGHAISTDGRPFWIGDFNGDGKSDVLFYYPGDDNWWLGTFDTDNKIHQWILADNTAGQSNSVSKANFGHAITSDGRPFWIGNFSAVDRAQILFYYPS